MNIDDRYAEEEQAIIDDETLTREERKQALRDLYRKAQEYMR